MNNLFGKQKGGIVLAPCVWSQAELQFCLNEKKKKIMILSTFKIS